VGEWDAPSRTIFAVVVALGLGVLLVALPSRAIGRRDLAMTGYAAAVAVLGTYAFVGGSGAIVAGLLIVGAFALGVAIYVVLGLASRWAERED
jgi:hypothetical protein